jgi:YVTN family beta-propeller protein
MDRRRFILLTGAAAACRKPAARGPASLAIIANSEGLALAAVDLRVFTLIRHIPLGARPSALTVLGDGPQLVALTPENGTLHRVDAGTLAVNARRQIAGSASSLRATPDGQSVYVLADSWFIKVDANTLRPEWQLGINEPGASFALSPSTPHAVLSGHAGRITVVDLGERRFLWQRKLTNSPGPVRFFKNGSLLLIGDRAGRRMLVVETMTGETVVDLPLGLGPENFCFKQDGGQLFVTGKGLDAVAIVYPYQTQLAGTVLAGRAPGPMAASSGPDLLFVANSNSGEVTVIDIRNHKVRAVVSVGHRADALLVTPDNNFVLVLNRESGDMAVLRVGAMSNRRTKAAPLFTIVPVGSGPVDIVVAEV